ncbi:MAG: guanylate kinase [Candidatus Sericytochromatia bacterium]|nr:guanylate kinase [Candidatus Sericytochromatia bacterium]
MEATVQTSPGSGTGPLARATSRSRQGMLVVVSGPSGVGKGTLVRKLTARDERLVASVSVTTRSPRPGEQDGVHYFFRSTSDFEQMVADGALLEYAAYVTGLYYGTPRAFVEERLAEGRDVILEIDVKGAMQVKERWPEAVFVFLLPPTMEALEHRLIKRQTEALEAIRQRLAVAVDEINFLPMYDYQVVNDDLERAAATLDAIITAERSRVSRRLKRH